MRLYPHTEEEVSRYTWDEFTRLAVYCTNIQGSALYDATLGDQELVDQMYAEMREAQSKKRQPDPVNNEPYHPARRGYSREVEALYDVVDNLVALRAEMGRWPSTTTAKHFATRPLFPAEAARERMRAYARSRRDQAVARAQQQWREEHDES